MHKQWRLELAIILALTAVALGVRLYRLPEIPIGLYSDEAANGVDALDILNGQHAIFFERNNGREPLFIYLQAVAVALLGATPLALRLTAAIIGALTVPAVYWLSREVLAPLAPGVRAWAVWPALFVAFSYWHITFSRLGFRAIMLPFLAALTFAWFWRAWRRLVAGGRFPWLPLILCGVTLGVTLYTYIAARFVPVVLLLVALSGAVLDRQRPGFPWRALLAVGVIGLAAFGVFAPLASYFVAHPASFAAHSAANSVVRELAATNTSLPVALASHVLKTFGMFGFVADQNWRFNPAGRPVFDLLLSIWLFAGVILAVWRRRSLPYLFVLIWFGVLALPALLSDKAPHSLRMIGIVPAAYLLVALAMQEVGRRLAGRRRSLAVWLPLPFLLISGATGLHDYFTPWQRENAELKQAFDTRFVEAVPAMLRDSRPDSVWIFPLWPVYSRPEPSYIVDFLTQRQIAYGTVKVGEDQSPEELRKVTEGYRLAHLLRWKNAALEPDGAYAMVDRKNLLAFLLDKHGRAVAEYDSDNIGYTTYELPASPIYRVADDAVSENIFFGGKIRLIGLSAGHTATSRTESAAALDEKSVPSGHTAWAVLRWQAQQPVANKFKTSLYLADESGHLAGQVDDLLLSDLYLYKSNWETDESGSTYHILPTFAGTPPGRYALFLAVYDPETMQRLPVLDAQGRPAGSAARLLTLEITRPIASAQVQPGNLLPTDGRLAPDVTLLGYDLDARLRAPGDQLPLTLYWRADAKPGADYWVAIELLDAQGQTLLQRRGRLASDAYPTNDWSAGEILRGWHDLAIAPTIPGGVYQLQARLLAADRELGRVNLGEIQIRGRARNFTPPAVQHLAAYTLGREIAFTGFGFEAAAVHPGDPLDLTLIWHALNPVNHSYTVFVHLLGSDGKIWTQQDNLPDGGASLTSGWIAGEYITDTYRLAITPNTPPGEYQVAIGMYDPATGVRLPVYTDGQPHGDRILLTPLIRVEAK